MTKIVIKSEYCKGCELCIQVCRQGVLSIGKTANALGYNIVEVDEVRECVGCMNCSVMCPEGAIEVYK